MAGPARPFDIKPRALVMGAGVCCGSTRTYESDGGNDRPCRCSDSLEYFSVKTGSLMHNSSLPLREWAFAIYIHLTSLMGVSDMKAHRDIGVSQKSAWFMLQSIHEAWVNDSLRGFVGSVEVDETYIGGREKKSAPAISIGPGGGRSAGRRWPGRTSAFCSMPMNSFGLLRFLAISGPPHSIT